MTLAISLSSDVKSIGAYVAFAAIIGLALLILLYFAQARELRRQSEQIEELEERLRRAPLAAQPQPQPRPALAVQPAPSAVPVASVAAAPPTATVAVPGARRVAVTPASPGATGAVTAVRPAGAVPAATAAGAAAAAAAEADETPAGAEEGVEAPRAFPPAPASAPAGERSLPPAPGEAQANADPAPAERTVDQGSVTTRRTPRAEAVDQGSTTVVRHREVDEGSVTVPRADRIVDEHSTPPAAMAPTDSVERPPGAAAVPLVARRAATAEPVGAARAEAAAGTVAAPPRPDHDETPTPRLGERGDLDEAEDPPPLAPATAAGARTRFPPSPEDSAAPAELAVEPPERAAPVSATARVATATVGGGVTVRRERRAPQETDDGRAAAPKTTLRLIGIAIVLAAVLIFVASQLLSSGSPAKPAPLGPTAIAGPNSPQPSTITVAVLNGTTTSGLASRVSSTLVSEGFRPGRIANAPSQDHRSTLIEYIGGNHDAGYEVARQLGLTTTQVVPADAATISAASVHGVAPTIAVVIGANYVQP